jgi:large subunit ribosomal protein L25
MTKNFILHASTRPKENKKPVKGNVWAVIYGPDFENQNLTLKLSEFEKIYNEAGESSLIDLKIDNEKSVKVIVKTVDRDVVRHHIIHIDFMAVDLKQEIEVETPINYIGVAPAVKELNGTLVYERESLLVSCTPDKFAESIDVDLSGLKTFDDSIKAGDVALPEGVTLAIDPSQLIVNIMQPRSASEEEIEQEEAAEAAETEAEAKEGDKKTGEEVEAKEEAK